MQIVPLDAVPSQTLTTVLNAQECVIHVYQRTTGLYLDLWINGTTVLVGVICHDRTLLVLNTYLGLLGDLTFIDTLGTADPDYTALGSRWLLAFLLPSEIAAPAAVVPFWVPGATIQPVPTPTPTLTPTPSPTATATPTPTPVAPAAPVGPITIT